MGFFDEDNTQFERTMMALTVVLALYIGSYVVIRSTNTHYEERDGCPLNGCEVVSLPPGTFYTFYKPVILADDRLSHAEFRFGW